jgi:peptidyl-prolyl cis-trans isomerase SurA
LIRSMKASLIIAAVLLLWPPVSLAETIDRMVAVVNRQVINLSDVEREIKTQELEAPVVESGEASRLRKLTEEQATQRLIEQVLISQQIQEFPGTEVSAREIDAQIEQMQSKAGGPEAWQEQLSQIGISLNDVRERVRWQLQIMKFIDLRFRQFVVVDQNEIEAYYTKRFLPDLRRRATEQAPELSEVEDQILNILIEEKSNVQVNEWLASLRANATIEIFH